MAFSLALAISSPLLAQSAASQPAAAVSFDIPAQPLDSALTRLADQGGIRILFAAGEVAGLQAPAVSGRYTPEQALATLLGRSGLAWHWREPGIAVVSRTATAAAAPTEGKVATGTLNVAGQRADALAGAQRDIRHADEVYDLNLSSVYAGKQQVERYKGAAPADLLKGMVNVYSGDARNSGALDPNIRGIQGPGRVPVSIDGTEQALTVWRGYMGANNRNYIDPNLIGGIQVIKGPQLQRDVNTSVGGAVVISTLDVDDILKEGEGFGGEVRVEGSNNSISPRLPTLLTGQRYRDIPGWPAAYWQYYDPSLYVKPRGDNRNHPFSSDDQAYRVALGWRSERVDLMAAYAYREKGNHFAGKKDASYYANEVKSTTNYIPFLARIYRPGDEVPNTSAQLESWLGKLTWRISDSQVLKLGVRDTLSHYGEIMPSRITWVDTAKYGVPQWPLSRVDAKAYNLEYKLQPQGNRWLDLYANLWQTDTISDTYSSGGRPNDNSFYQVPNANRTGTVWVNSEYLRNTGVANADNTRKGINLSNRLLLRDNLQLTLGASYQHEQLRSKDDYWDPEIASTFRMLPRAGRRVEKDFNLKLEWQPFERLELAAGLRYQASWAVDDLVENFRTAGYEGLLSREYANWYGLSYLTADPSLTEQDIQEIRDEYIAEGFTGWRLENAMDFSVFTVRNYALWFGDENGKFSRATNIFLNGTLDGVEIRNASADRGQTQMYPRPETTKTQWVTAKARQRGSAWSPMLSAAFHLNDDARLYFVHSQARRYPSMFESTLGFSASVSAFDLKPEHVYNYELGYVHDLSQWLRTGSEGHADLKLAYYHHRTLDVIERDPSMLFSNVDKQTIRGIELQGRYDNGRFFADLSAAHTLENTVCDESTAARLDPVEGTAKDCVKTGFVSGYLVSQAIPDWTVNALLGMRLLDRKLELGTRGVYYSAFDNPYEGNYGTQANVSYYSNVPMQWGRILTYDAYVAYRPSKALAVELVGTNLGNLYYIDPLTRSAMAAPGRTLKLSVNYRF